MKPTTLAFFALITASGASFGATASTSQLLIHFDGSLAGTAYTLGAGETDTTGTFQAYGTPTVSAGAAALAGGTSNDGFYFNPASLGALTTQNWVAEAIVSFDAFAGGQRTMIDVQGDTDFRVNNDATGLEANFWDGAPANTNLTAPLPATGVSAHYALVWNAATNELSAYINGVSIGTTSGSKAFNTPDASNVSFGYLGRAGVIGRSIDGSLTKTGPGTLSLTGANTYAGATTVSEGTLAVNGTALADTGSLVLDGGVVQPTGTETVDKLFFGDEQQDAGIWGSPTSGAQFTDARIAGTDGLIEVKTGPPTGYANWAGGFAGFTDTAPGSDFDKDGLANGIEWVLGGNPTVNDAAAIAPNSDNTSDSDHFLFIFHRSDLANADSGTTIEVQYDSDLAGWTTATDGAGGVSITAADDAVATGIDRVTVSIPRTLAAGGKLFVRLKAEVAR